MVLKHFFSFFFLSELLSFRPPVCTFPPLSVRPSECPSASDVLYVKVYIRCKYSLDPALSDEQGWPPCSLYLVPLSRMSGGCSASLTYTHLVYFISDRHSSKSHYAMSSLQNQITLIPTAVCGHIVDTRHAPQDLGRNSLFLYLPIVYHLTALKEASSCSCTYVLSSFIDQTLD